MSAVPQIGTESPGNPTAQTKGKPSPSPPQVPARDCREDEGEERKVGGAREGLKCPKLGEERGMEEEEEEEEPEEEEKEQGVTSLVHPKADTAKRSSRSAGPATGDTPSCPSGPWAGMGHSPAPRHHQLHFHLVGNDDAQDLPIGSFPQPAERHGEAVHVGSPGR